jgi:nucleoside-diphosphate-sugar epimerase
MADPWCRQQPAGCFFRAERRYEVEPGAVAKCIDNFVHHELDIRDRQGVIDLIAQCSPMRLFIRQHSQAHDRAAAIPFEDFDTNAVGTFNLLEATRRYSTAVPFVHMSTNKVYGDAPNAIEMVELETSWDYADPNYANGIPETFSIDQSKHSLFGASASVQRYFRSGIRKLFQYAYGLPERRLPDRAKPFRR